MRKAELQAENRRLKEALREITQTDIWFCDKKQQGDYGCNRMIEAAKKALKEL